MKLSEFPKEILGEIMHDGHFSNIGMLHQQKLNILCPVVSHQYLDEVIKNKAITCLITTKDLADKIPPDIGVWLSPDPLGSFFELHNYFLKLENFYGETVATKIAKNCLISSKAHISKHNIILHDRVSVGNHSTITGRTEICIGTNIADNVVIGGDGFEVKTMRGVPSIIKHAGNVFIGKNVEIQPFSAIDRGLFNDQTYIGNNVKMDSYVHIAHNATVLDNTIIASSAKIMGSTHIGKDVFISPGAIINNRVTIGEGSFIGVGEIVLKDVPPYSAVHKGEVQPR